MLNSYLQKHALFSKQIISIPTENLSMIMVIPCYDEPDLIRSLKSILAAELPSEVVEVIIVINDSERDEESLKKRNLETYFEVKDWSKQNSTHHLKFHVLYHSSLPAKKAGVGLARKIGMDEAVYRLESIGNSRGIILCFDADSLCLPNYFKAIESHFKNSPNAQAASIYFEHPTEGEEYSPEIYQSIISYELHLRYYINAKRYAGFPHAFQTIGSSMAVRSDAYQKQGGMNQRKAGEDFYFLNKFIPLGNFSEINSTTVIPSPRTSNRVPFGTGKAIAEMLKSNQELTTYAPQIFMDLKIFFSKIRELFSLRNETIESLVAELPESISSFLKNQNFQSKLIEIQSNTSEIETFENRFYQWFNAFLIMKYVHHARDLYYPNVSVEAAGRWLLKNYFEQSDTSNLESKELLLRLRQEDKKAQ